MIESESITIGLQVSLTARQFQQLDMKRIEALNKALKEFTSDLKLMTDTDGLIVSKEDHIYEIMT